MLFVFSTWPRDIFYLQHYWLVCVIKDSYTAALGGGDWYSMATTSSTAHNLSQGFAVPLKTAHHEAGAIWNAAMCLNSLSLRPQLLLEA